MNLETLRRIIDDYNSEASMFCVDEVLDAFAMLTCTDAITRERLEALGFEPIGGDENRLHIGVLTVNYYTSPDGVFFSREGASNPQPLHMGDVHRLVERLSRPSQKTGEK